MILKKFSTNIDPKAFLDGMSSVFMPGVPPERDFLDFKSEQENLKSDVENLKKDFEKAFGIIENEKSR